MSKNKNVDESLVRREVRRTLAEHLSLRGDLSLAKEEVYALAAQLSLSWSYERCRLIAALAREPNMWSTKRGLAYELGVSQSSVENQWNALQHIRLTVGGKEFAPFRRGWELRFRHSKADVRGGVCLHLNGDPPMNYAEERTITDTTRASTEVHARNFAQSSERQEAAVPQSERSEIARTREETLRGAHGPQIALVLQRVDAA